MEEKGHELKEFKEEIWDVLEEGNGRENYIIIF